MTALLVGVTALIGCALLVAAACVALVPVVGTAGALGLIGLAFMMLAAGTLLLHTGRRQGAVRPTPSQKADPSVQMNSDLSFLRDRTVSRSKH